ncbi:MAG: 50S ribosomal protein L25 [Planctomycetes bacterium]|nr:50S ribosomal protein L25 [Planctomycetota bacterium]
MEVARMKAERRTALGRNQLAKLRTEGWMPAVVYGAGKEPVSIQISEWELEQHIKSHHKVFQLDISGASESAYLQEVSWKAINDRPLHADFRRIDLTQKIEAEVEVTLLGHPVGLGKGGALTKDHLVITISALPTAIPEAIEVDISKMEVDDVLRAKDLQLPAGVELAVAPELTICHVVRAVVAAEAPPAEGEGEAEKK